MTADRSASLAAVSMLACVAFGWQQATRNNEFYASPDLALDFPGYTGGLDG